MMMMRRVLGTRSDFYSSFHPALSLSPLFSLSSFPTERKPPKTKELHLPSSTINPYLRSPSAFHRPAPGPSPSPKSGSQSHSRLIFFRVTVDFLSFI